MACSGGAALVSVERGGGTDDKDETEHCGDVECSPVPASVSCSGKQADASGDYDRPGDEAQEWIWEPEERSLPGGQVLAALHNDAEVTGRCRAGVQEYLELFVRQRESGDEADDARNDEGYGKADGLCRRCLSTHVCHYPSRRLNHG